MLQAAERGDAEMQFNLAVVYENGTIDSRYAIEGSRSEAKRWFLAAAEQGLARAQVRLAEIYAAEPGGSLAACKWYLLAARGLRGEHLQKAQSAYRRVALSLTPAQSAELGRFAQDGAAKGAFGAAIPDHPATTSRMLA